MAAPFSLGSEGEGFPYIGETEGEGGGVEEVNILHQRDFGIAADNGLV